MYTCRLILIGFGPANRSQNVGCDTVRYERRV